MKHEIQNLLVDIKNRLPENAKEKFATGIKSRMNQINEITEIDTSAVTKSTIIGMLGGAVLDLVPGLETLAGVEGFVDIGAAIGAFVGLAKSESEKRQREGIRKIIVEELNNVAPHEA